MDEETTEMVETEETVVAESVDEVEQVETDEVDDPAAGLKSALQKERQARRDLEKRLKEFEREAAARDLTPDERVIEEARREAAAEATQAANQRIVQTEFRSLAKERGIDPKAAVRLADLSAVDVGDDGAVDVDDLTSALDALLSEFPSLVPSRFQGTADQGSRAREAGSKQITSAAELKNMSAEEVNQARREGRLNKLLGIS